MGDELDEGSMEALDRLAGPQVIERIKSRLGGVLGENISGQLAEWLAPRLEVQERIRMAIGPDAGPNVIAGHAEDWLLDIRPSLKAGDWARLASLADREKQHGLLFLSAVWGRPADPQRRERALSQMNSGAYQRILRLCPGRVAPMDLLTPVQGALLIQRLVDQDVDDEELVAVLLSLRKGGYRGPIPVPAERIKAMKRSVVKLLIEVPGSGWRQDPEFFSAVLARFEQLDREPSFFARLIPWSRKRGNVAEDTDQSQDP